MGKTAQNCWYSRSSLLSFAIFFPPLAFILFLIFGLTPFLVTISILTLSTIFLVTFTKKEVVLGENELLNKLQPVNEISTQIQTYSQSEADEKQENQVEVVKKFSADDINEFVESRELRLTLMCSRQNVENSSSVTQDLGFSENYSDSDSDSEDDDDDDSLIEIALPIATSEQKQQPFLSDFFQESISRQEDLMELLADINEMNEEDNLFEIDISIGSIKCPVFEIEA